MTPFDGGSISFTQLSTNDETLIDGSELDLARARGQFTLTAKIASGDEATVSIYCANLSNFSDEFKFGEVTGAPDDADGFTLTNYGPMPFRFVRLKLISGAPDTPGTVVATVFIRDQNAF